jgi:ABC-2 type transport system permease protein
MSLSPTSPTPDGAALVRVNAPQPFWGGFLRSVRDIVSYRELLVNLVRKELKVKYKDSALGFFWTLARPTLLLAVYFVVFGKFLQAGIPKFPIYLFSGLVAWDLFGATMGATTMAIVGNSGLVKKVYFPREILPLAAVGAGLVNFVLQLLILFVVMLGFRYPFMGVNLLLLPVAFVGLLIFMSAMGLLLAAANVYLRDTQHLLEVVLLLWFWMTPIVYPVNTALLHLRKAKVFGVQLATLYLLNPMANVVIGFQRAIYRRTVVNGTPTLYQASDRVYLARELGVIVFSLALLWLAQRIFTRVQGNFAQEL